MNFRRTGWPARCANRFCLVDASYSAQPLSSTFRAVFTNHELAGAVVTVHNDQLVEGWRGGELICGDQFFLRVADSVEDKRQETL
ncbi:MAG: hypothetical protein CMJ81_01020 [Planctomycetaceae bacterium]|nr:hypothetical protein [Planctomycetaceae bacterium]